MTDRIIHYPHPTLRYPSKTVRRVDAPLKQIIAGMFDLMYEHNGVGLAANQVDLPLRIFVANPSGQRGDGEELVCINPELNLPKGRSTDREGCLSLPELHAEVTRPEQVRLSAYDAAGNLVQRPLHGFLARVVQHEFDHLAGILFFDRIDDDQKQMFQPMLRVFEREYAQGQLAGDILPEDELVKRRQQWEQRYA